MAGEGSQGFTKCLDLFFFLTKFPSSCFLFKLVFSGPAKLVVIRNRLWQSMLALYCDDSTKGAGVFEVGLCTVVRPCLCHLLPPVLKASLVAHAYMPST